MDLAKPFDKSKPITPINAPTYSWAEYWIFGYTTDAAGIRHPRQFRKMLPCGTSVRLNKKDIPDNFTVTGTERAVGGPRLI
jgi:hypothetical protein